jgi:type IV pilus assembly protein PilO
MRDESEIWRLRLWVWVPALLFFLANGVAFSIYRFGYAGQVQSLEADLGEVKEQLQPQAVRRKVLQNRIQRASAAEAAVKQLYEEKFSTRSQRLTRVTAEVKDLARRAGLNPRALSYPEQGIEDYGLVKRSFVFSVEGTYQELRQFINLMEHSPSFLTLEAVTLSEAGEEQGPELRMNLMISTLFSQETGPEELGAARRAAGAPRAREES